jgi:hypothetical protein
MRGGCARRGGSWRGGWQGAGALPGPPIPPSGSRPNPTSPVQPRTPVTAAARLQLETNDTHRLLCILLYMHCLELNAFCLELLQLHVLRVVCPSGRSGWVGGWVVCQSSWPIVLPCTAPLRFSTPTSFPRPYRTRTCKPYRTLRPHRNHTVSHHTVPSGLLLVMSCTKSSNVSIPPSLAALVSLTWASTSSGLPMALSSALASSAGTFWKPVPWSLWK